MAMRAMFLLTTACLLLVVAPGRVRADEVNSGFGEALFTTQGHPALSVEPVSVVEALESLGDISPAAGEANTAAGISTDEPVLPAGEDTPLQNLP